MIPLLLLLHIRCLMTVLIILNQIFEKTVSNNNCMYNISDNKVPRKMQTQALFYFNPVTSSYAIAKALTRKKPVAKKI